MIVLDVRLKNIEPDKYNPKKSNGFRADWRCKLPHIYSAMSGWQDPSSRVLTSLICYKLYKDILNHSGFF